MFQMINFGDSPFYILFVIVAAIATLTLLANAVAGFLTYTINRRTARLQARLTGSKARP